MPIRINLLAEAQALEEMRRRDPVKRAIRLAVLLGVLILVWAGYLQTRILNVKSEVSRLQAQHQARTNDYRQVIANKRKWEDATEKLDARGERRQVMSGGNVPADEVLGDLRQVIELAPAAQHEGVTDDQAHDQRPGPGEMRGDAGRQQNQQIDDGIHGVTSRNIYSLGHVQKAPGQNLVLAGVSGRPARLLRGLCRI